MSYVKTVWLNDGLPAINATNLNKIEAGIADNDVSANSNAARISVLEVSENTTGWEDLIGKFDVNAKGVTAPTVVILPNGLRALRFDVGNSVFNDYHIEHDGVDGSDSYPHIHMFSDTAMTVGETIIWTGQYILARGYTQGDSFLAARTVITLTYTAPAGGVIAGDHIVLEGTAIGTETIIYPEPDTIIDIEWTRTGGTFVGNVFGLQADIHYQTVRDNTPNRNFPFS